MCSVFRYHMPLVVVVVCMFSGLPASNAAHKSTTKVLQREDDLEDIVKPRTVELSLRQVPAKKHEPVKIILPHLTMVC